jgi:hypothetical protein
MNLEHVSADSRTYSRKGYRTGKDPSAHLVSNRSGSEPDPFIFNAQIDRILRRICDQNLLGLEHVRQYLHDQHRRNCRPNTIRSTGVNLTGFLRFLKDSGIYELQTLTREHIAAFVEREQDRGLSPNSVSTQLRCIYAFVNFLVEHDVLNPDLLKRKLRIKVPDALPRAIDPQHVQRLLAAV